MNDLQLSISITIAVFSSIVTVIISIAPLYRKIGYLQGEIKILKDKLYSLCSKINDMERWLYGRHQ